MFKRNPNRFSGEKRTSQEIAQLMRDINAIEAALISENSGSSGSLVANLSAERTHSFYSAPIAPAVNWNLYKFVGADSSYLYFSHINVSSAIAESDRVITLLRHRIGTGDETTLTSFHTRIVSGSVATYRYVLKGDVRDGYIYLFCHVVERDATTAAFISKAIRIRKYDVSGTFVSEFTLYRADGVTPINYTTQPIRIETFCVSANTIFCSDSEAVYGGWIRINKYSLSGSYIGYIYVGTSAGRWTPFYTINSAINDVTGEILAVYPYSDGVITGSAVYFWDVSGVLQTTVIAAPTGAVYPYFQQPNYVYTLSCDSDGNWYLLDTISTNSLYTYNSSNVGRAYWENSSVLSSDPFTDYLGSTTSGYGAYYMKCLPNGQLVFAGYRGYAIVNTLETSGNLPPNNTVSSLTQTPWYLYLTDQSRVSVGTPDGGVLVPTLNFLNSGIPKAELDSGVSVEALSLRYIHDMRAALIRIAKTNGVVNAVTGDPFNWADSDEDNLYYGSMGLFLPSYGVTDGVSRYDWVEKDLAYKETKDLHIGEIYHIVRELERALHLQGIDV